MSTQRVENKERVYDFSNKIHDATPESIEAVLEEYYTDDVDWYGPAPIDDLDGVETVAEEYWKPLLESFPDLQQNDYTLFGGEYDGSEWVMTTGNLVGTFENDWLGIPATGHATWLRYGAFHKFEDGEIVQTRLILDVLDAIRQAGYTLVPALAPEVVIPGPATQDGIILGESDANESEQTMALVEEMLFNGLNTFEEKGLENMGMERYWHEEFMWYGPAGIGTTRGIDGFREYHQNPFLEVFPDREVAEPQLCRIAEGNYCASTGWPDVVGTHTGSGWLGLPATGTEVEMRVIDVWRREGDKLAENWVFIDMLDLLDQFGIDVLEQLEKGQTF
jgi:predicted ester cyclase